MDKRKNKHSKIQTWWEKRRLQTVWSVLLTLHFEFSSTQLIYILSVKCMMGN